MLRLVERYTRGDEEPDLLRGIAAGAVGGFVGTLRMSGTRDVWHRINRAMGAAGSPEAKAAARRGQKGDAPFGDRTTSAARQKLASAAIRTVKDGPVTARQKEIGDEVLHKLMGVGLGAAYGAAVEYAPVLRHGYGVPLGVAAFLLMREGAVPLAGLAPKPSRHPPADHLLSFASHLAFGVFTELVRRQLRRSMRAD